MLSESILHHIAITFQLKLKAMKLQVAFTQRSSNVLFVTEFCERVFTAHTRTRSLQTFKISRIPLCLCVRITLSAIIVSGELV